MYNWTELNEIADGMGDFNYTVTPEEALILAKRALPDETATVTANLAEAIRIKSFRRPARR